MLYLEILFIASTSIFLILQGPLYYRWHNFPGRRAERIPHIKEVLLNSLGSIVGWSSAYYLLFCRLRYGFNSSDLGIADLVLFLIAFYGMTGYLPHILIEKLKLGR